MSESGLSRDGRTASGSDLFEDDRERVEQIQARADAATDGPWRIVSDQAGEFYGAGDCYDVAGANNVMVTAGGPVEDGGPSVGAMEKHDAEFIAAAREDVPWLSSRLLSAWDEISALRNEIDRHRPCVNCQHRASVHGNGYSGCFACDCGAFVEPPVAVDAGSLVLDHPRTVTEELVESAQWAVRQINAALDDSRLDDAARAWLLTVRRSLVSDDGIAAVLSGDPDTTEDGNE